MDIFSFEIENYEGDFNKESASALIVSACQLLPKSSSVISDHLRNVKASPCPVNKVYEIRCGSSAEFYIRPLNTCIDDIDFLHVRADEMAFNGIIPVLPEDVCGLSETIICNKIEPCPGYPGFIRLLLLGEMKYNWKHKYYEFNHTPHANRYLTINSAHSEYVSHFRFGDRCLLSYIISGPAIKCPPREGLDAGFDFVNSMWCPQWPNEAQKWITRRRKFGWPMIDTISEVVQNGCHIVYVQHRAFIGDKQQFRFSFSLAEITLLQSWTKVQQIVYHLFRFFSKRVLIQKNCPKEAEVLCTYHLKTLMLWTCEEMPQKWWNSASVITICHEMLLKLSEWLRKRSFPNYFIPEANLFPEHLSITMLDKTERRLNEFRNSRVLCDWFVNNYIMSIIRIAFSHMTTSQVMPHFANFMLPLFDIWNANESYSTDTLFHYTLMDSLQNIRHLIKAGCSSGMRNSLQNLHEERCMRLSTTGKLPIIPTKQKMSFFSYYDSLLCILHCAFGLGCGEISWDNSLIVELIKGISIKPKFIKSQYHNFPKTYKAHTELCGTQSSESHASLYQSSDCRFQFLCAQGLLENLTGPNNGPLLFELVSFMSKAYLRKALEYDDSELEGIAPAALVYLAALHFASTEYQEAIRLCLAVLSSKIFYKDNYYTLNAGCLFFIDDVARIVGLYVLHQKMTEVGLRYINKILYIDLRISPEMFAYYLAVLYADGTSTDIVFNHELPDTAFPMDDYLKAVLKPNCRSILCNATKQTVYRRRYTCTMAELSRTDNPTKETVIIELLMKYALENMTSLYNVIRRDLGMQCNTDDCYSALYLYKRRKYDEVLHLCKQIILDESDLQSDMKRLALANVLLLPPLDSFFDEDVQSLLGFHTLFCYLSHLREGERISECIKNSKLAHWHCSYCMNFIRNIHCMNTPPKNDISCNLQCNCAIEYVNVLGGHFLARYLKVRCCIDCNLPHTDALTEFAAHKVHRPFERIIRGFLLHKLRVI